MPIHVLECPKCGAPIPPDGARRAVWVCGFCQATLAGGPDAVWFASLDPDAEGIGPDPPELAHLPRATVAGRDYRVLGRLARGDGSDVFLARRVGRLSELVVLKIVRAMADGDLLAREWRALEALHGSDAQGAHYFARLLPQLVAHGSYTGSDGMARPASVFRWRSGFLHTLDEVAQHHPEGVDGRTAVWMWKRTLELLGFLHRSGWVHGAVLPQHLLIHPRDHGVVLVGFSSATRIAARAPLPAVSADNRVYYPSTLWDGAPPTPASDIAMSARCMVRVLGGDPAKGTLPRQVPAPLADLVRVYADPSPRPPPTQDAWALMQEVGHMGSAAYGKPKYHRLVMPGWR